MSDYLLNVGSRATPQSEPLIDVDSGTGVTTQVPNSAGGYSWAVDEWTALSRFLILGSEGGSYYASERDLTKAIVGQSGALRKCIASDGPRVVNELVEISQQGRAPKNDPALYVLAAAMSFGDNATKSLAAEMLPNVARIGTHLYHFVAYAETMRGWGRTMRWAVQNWYDQNPEQLALQVIKYRQRDGWSHRDLLRLAHPKTQDANLNALFGWVAHPTDAHYYELDQHAFSTVEINAPKVPTLIGAFEQAQASDSPATTAKLVRHFRLPREALLTEHLAGDEGADVWRALLDVGMPMTAMIRNLATMTRLDVLERFSGSGASGASNYTKLVINAITSREGLRKARVHPLNLLIALKTYASGQGMRGGNTWTPISAITDALDEAFYLAFANVEPTGKNYRLALDVSGSMGWGNIAGTPLTPRDASAAMALVTVATEPNTEVMAFSHQLVPLAISGRQQLDDVIRTIEHIPMGGTDCALPITSALNSGLGDIDVFVTYTDSETWFGNIHPKQALDGYRNLYRAGAKSVVVGMVANNFTIADPADVGMLDVVGFDTTTPQVISEFSKGF